MKETEKLQQFANSFRGKYIISQALFMSSKHLKKLEDRANMYPPRDRHAEPSNRHDMEYLLKLFPTYVDIKTAEEKIINSRIENGKV